MMFLEPNKNLKILLEKHRLPLAHILDFTAFQETPLEIAKNPFAFHLQQMKKWLKNKFHGKMGFMETGLIPRSNPKYVLNSVQSALVILFPYATGEHVRGKNKDKENTDHVNAHQKPQLGSFLQKVSRYARSADYHHTIKKHLNALAEDIQKQYPMEYRAITDSVPFLEKPLGQMAGLGFIGKNSLLIRPGVGSYFFIGTLLTSLKPSILGSVPNKNHALQNLSCGSCTKCMDACPTQAIVEPYVVDSNHCLAYHTIENHGSIPEEFYPHFKDIVFGCDICQEVCPYNLKTLDLVTLKEFQEVPENLANLSIYDVLGMDKERFHKTFKGTAMSRTKYQGMIRNLLIYLYANGDEKLGFFAKKYEDSKCDVVKSFAKFILKKTKL